MALVSLATGTFASPNTTDILNNGGNVRKGIASEAIGQGNACYFGSGSFIAKSVSTKWLVTGTGGMIDFDGFAMQDYAPYEPVTLYGKGCLLEIISGGTADTALWVSATAGILSDARIAAVDLPVAKAISATKILVLR